MMGWRPKEEGGRRREAGESRRLIQAGSQRSGAGNLDEQGAVADEEDKQVGQGGAGQHCCCPAFSLASRFKYHKSTAIK